MLQCYIGVMNSDTEILVSEILATSEAVAKCEVCGNYLIATDDPDAADKAFGMATNAWKNGDRGFRGMDRKDVIDAIQRALILAPSKCPSCG